MPRGGKRVGAGNKIKYTFSDKLQLANDVTLLVRKHGISKKAALELLNKSGVIIRPPFEYKRYLTPKYFDSEAMNILLESDRVGILSALPRLRRGKF